MARFDIQSDLDKLSAWTRDITRGMDRDGIEQTLRGVAISFIIKVVRRNPVDRGQSRAGWTLYTDSIGVPVQIGGSDPAAVALGKSQGSFRVDHDGRRQFIEIVNAVPYIVMLEFGHSDQAPGGMVRITIAEITGTVIDEEALAAVNKVVREADRKARFA